MIFPSLAWKKVPFLECRSEGTRWKGDWKAKGTEASKRMSQKRRAKREERTEPSQCRPAR